MIIFFNSSSTLKLWFQMQFTSEFLRLPSPLQLEIFMMYVILLNE